MAELIANQNNNQAFSFMKIKGVKHLMLFLGLSISIAIGVYVVLWAKDPNLIPIYAELDASQTSQVIDVLEKNKIKFKYSGSTGNILVANDKIHEIRMRLAALGLPKGSNDGYELLDKPAGLGSSQFMETVRYRRSIEGELAKTIKSLDAIRNARVHLGVAKESSFIRKNNPSSASIMVDLFPGKDLDKSQITGIIHLVSASVPGLKRENVSIIDNQGNLLNDKTSNSAGYSINEEMSFVKHKEQELTRKIKEILYPIYGEQGVKAEVNAEIDFTYEESTKENYDSNKPKVRSETTFLEGKKANVGAKGVPGAISNVPPMQAKLKTQNSQSNVNEIPVNEVVVVRDKYHTNYRNQAIRNYELDKSIIHTKQSVGKVVRLTVAVLVNNQEDYNEKGDKIFRPLTAEEIKGVEVLVKNCIGFNEERGDKVTIVNKSFLTIPKPKELKKRFFDEILENVQLIGLLKQIISGIFVLGLVFFAIKPIIKYFAHMHLKKTIDDSLNAAKNNLENNKDNIEFGQKEIVEHAKNIAKNDTKKAASVLMNWFGNDN